MELPNLLEQHLAGDEPALAAHEKFEQPKFARLQRDLLPAAVHGARNKIHFEVARPQHCGRRPQGRAARERGEPRHQLLESEGLDEIIVAARLQSVDPIVDARQIGEEKHRRRNAFGAHQRDHAEAVELWQHAVKNDRIEAIGGRALEFGAAVSRDRRLVPARLQACRDEVGGPFVVLDNQNLHPAELSRTADYDNAPGHVAPPLPGLHETGAKRLRRASRLFILARRPVTRPSAARCGSRSPGR